MPIIKSAIKRMRQTAKRRARNVTTKRNLKDAVKAFITKPTAAGLSAAQSELDTAVKKNILPKNTAARRKAQLARVAREAGVKVEAKKAAKPAAAKKAPVKKAEAKPVAKKAAPAKKVVAAKKPAAKKPAAKKASK